MKTRSILALTCLLLAVAGVCLEAPSRVLAQEPPKSGQKPPKSEWKGFHDGKNLQAYLIIREEADGKWTVLFATRPEEKGEPINKNTWVAGTPDPVTGNKRLYSMDVNDGTKGETTKMVIIFVSDTIVTHDKNIDGKVRKFEGKFTVRGK